MPMQPERPRASLRLVRSEPPVNVIEIERYPMHEQASMLLAILETAAGGIALRSADPALGQSWVTQLQSLRQCLSRPSAMIRVPVNCGFDQLVGGVDMAASLLQATPGRTRVYDKGLLKRAAQSLLVLPNVSLHSRINLRAVCHALDNKFNGEGDDPSVSGCVIALDDARADPPDSSLTDRLAFSLTLEATAQQQHHSPRLNEWDDALHVRPLDTTRLAPALIAARAGWSKVSLCSTQLQRMCAVAEAYGIHSVRAQVFCARVARAIAALANRNAVTDADTDHAMSLCYSWRATAVPQETESTAEDEATDQPLQEPQQQDSQPQDTRESHSQPQSPAEQDDEVKAGDNKPNEDQIETAVASLPSDLLSALAAAVAGRMQTAGSVGRRGQSVQSASRGRQIGTQRYRAGTTQKIDLTATLHNAVPWQSMRREQYVRETGNTDTRRVLIQPQDIRAAKYRQSTQTVIVFAVDASGSAAAQRLAEAKGAVELLLAECYVRRDQVALIVFQGARASLVLPPTRSLVRARRELTQLPVGGGTPLPSAIDLAVELGKDIQRAGHTPMLCLLTDGRANVDRDGIGGRARATQQSLQAATLCGASGMQSLVIDTSVRASRFAAQLATTMGGRYLALPRADAGRISSAISSAAQSVSARAGASTRSGAA